MKLRYWAIVILGTTAVIGCADRAKEIQPTKLSEIDDTTKTQFQQVDLADASEIDLVEELHVVRADYKRLLKLLRSWYLQNGYYEKSEWASREMNDLLAIRTYPYLVVTEVAIPPSEPATTEIVEADELYEEALTLYREGQILPLVNDKKKLKRSLDIFRQIIEKYPSSTKSPEAAFYAAEILKEYFEENTQAVEFYKLALKLNPHIRQPVRFQMAVTCDFRLHDRATALEMYRRVLSEEADIDRTNTWFAKSRINQLLKEQQAEEMLKSKRPPVETQPVSQEPSMSQ